MSEHKKNYNEGRKAHSMPLEISRQLEKLKDTKEFKSIGETMQYLLDIQSDLEKSRMIVDRYKCKKCDRDAIVTEEMALDLHRFRHRNCKSEDPKDKDCDGMLRHTYKFIGKANGTKESNDKARIVTKSWMTPKGLVETIGDFDYINGKKVRTYLLSDPQQPMLDEEYDDVNV
jgi:hypothetical protein